MDIVVSARHTDITEALKSYAREKVSRLSRHFDKTGKVQVVLDVEDGRMSAEIILPVIRGRILTAKAIEKDMYAAIDVATDKIDRQLRKFKERLSDRRPHGGAKVALKSEGPEEETPSALQEDLE